MCMRRLFSSGIRCVVKDLIHALVIRFDEVHLIVYENIVFDDDDDDDDAVYFILYDCISI